MPSYHYWSPRGLGDLYCSMCLPCIWCFTHQMPEKSPPRPLIVTNKNVSVPNIAWGTKSLPLRTVGWKGHSTPSSRDPHSPVPIGSCQTEVSEWDVWQWAASQHWRKSLLLLEALTSSMTLFKFGVGGCFPSFIWILSIYSLLLCLLLQLLSHFRRGIFLNLACRHLSTLCSLSPSSEFSSLPVWHNDVRLREDYN